jgi:hypothetical protein
LLKAAEKVNIEEIREIVTNDFQVITSS